MTPEGLAKGAFSRVQRVFQELLVLYSNARHRRRKKNGIKLKKPHSPPKKSLG